MFTMQDFYNILNFLDGTDVTDLDTNTKILASSEQSVSLNLFENTIDQVPHMTDDYKRLKEFLVNWYASHRTIISTQKQVNDVFSLPEIDLNELIKSFGFIFSTSPMSFLTKCNFFLELVNLYKVKGTPQSLIDVLQFFGLTDIDIAEYWLEKDSKKNLIFRSERYLPPGVLDIQFSNIDFDSMIKDDPHWRLSKPQIENLITLNKIALPSKSPYFSIRPRYDLTELNGVMSIISRYVQDAYRDYISTGTVIRNIKLTQLNILVSFLELYLSCIYVFNKVYNGVSGSSDLSFYCYDGTSIPSATVILSEYDELTKRIPAPSHEQNESRSAHEEKIKSFYNVFTRLMTTNFLEYHDPEILLRTLNISLYDIFNIYIDSGNGEDLFSYLIKDLNDWIAKTLGYGYPNLATTILGLASMKELNKVINFFKPYHARIVKLEFALIFNNPLFDSVVMEDYIPGDHITETTVDFDTADSTACQICDSTCVSHYSRELFDCGSYFDLGASSDNVEIYVTDVFYGIWTITTSLPCVRQASAGIGNTSDALAFGGTSNLGSVYITQSDKWDGSLWVTTSAINNPRNYLAGCGITSDALSFGGLNAAVVKNTTEIWSGTAWATTTALNTGRYALAGGGSTSDALSFGGYSSIQTDKTEKWNGSAWATTTALNGNRYGLAGGGTTSSAISFGGNSATIVGTTEIWNGSTWTTTSVLNQIRYELAGCGNTSDALSFGGYTGLPLNTTEKWNGSIWSITTPTNLITVEISGCGTAVSALGFGGINSNDVEKWH